MITIIIIYIYIYTYYSNHPHQKIGKSNPTRIVDKLNHDLTGETILFIIFFGVTISLRRSPNAAAKKSRHVLPSVPRPIASMRSGTCPRHGGGGKHRKTMENHHATNGRINYTWCIYQIYIYIICIYICWMYISYIYINMQMYAMDCQYIPYAYI